MSPDDVGCCFFLPNVRGRIEAQEVSARYPGGFMTHASVWWVWKTEQTLLDLCVFSKSTGRRSTSWPSALVSIDDTSVPTSEAGNVKRSFRTTITS